MKKKIIFGILALALIAVLVFAFRNNLKETLSGNVVSTSDEIVAQVNGMSITQQEVDDAQAYIQAQTGILVNKTEALRRVIGEKLLLQEAQNHGFTFTIEETEKQISEILKRQNQTIEDFKKRLESQSKNYEIELESYREQFLIEKYLAETMAVPNITDSQALAYYNENKNKMFTNVTVPYAQISQQLKFALAKKQSQEELSAYIDKLYETANINYIKKKI